MSLCTRNRWGTGSSCSSSRNEIDKEMEEKLKKMREERNKQDTMWTKPTTSTDSKLSITSSSVKMGK
jgi:hypothetical protein